MAWLGRSTHNARVWVLSCPRLGRPGGRSGTWLTSRRRTRQPCRRLVAGDPLPGCSLRASAYCSQALSVRSCHSSSCSLRSRPARATASLCAVRRLPAGWVYPLGLLDHASAEREMRAPPGANSLLGTLVGQGGYHHVLQCHALGLEQHDACAGLGRGDRARDHVG